MEPLSYLLARIHLVPLEEEEEVELSVLLLWLRQTEVGEAGGGATPFSPAFLKPGGAGGGGGGGEAFDD